MMNEDTLFDEIARVLASPMPRRQALGRIFGGLAGAALATIVWPGRAQADAERRVRAIRTASGQLQVLQ